jgi:hypothetical protein
VLGLPCTRQWRFCAAIVRSLLCCPLFTSDLFVGCRPANGQAAPVAWVSAQYAEARAEARQKALLRNACFQQVGPASDEGQV